MTNAPTATTGEPTGVGRLLSLEEASAMLRFTPRLIIKCIAYKARKNGGIKLKCIDKNGEPCFSEADLHAYDQDLRKPWVNNPKEPRPDIPEFFKKYLQCETLMKCGLCDSSYSSEYAHIDPWENSLNHHPLNLINLCTKCHTGFDIERRISTREVQAAKTRLLERLLVSNNIKADAIDSKSLAAICKIIARLLEENWLIFQNFGPESPLAETSFENGADRVWRLRRKDTILPNNKEIATILKSHKQLYNADDSFKVLAEAFIVHEMSYEAFVAAPSKSHDNFRFPKGFAERIQKEVA